VISTIDNDVTVVHKLVLISIEL